MEKPKPLLGIFKVNPVRDQITAILNGNTGAIFRRFKKPRTGWTQLKLKRFPTSASEANYPQRVPRGK